VVDPEIAEAYAILWALKLAKTEKFPKIIVKRDSKLCEAINGNPEKANWKINAICFYVNRLALEFVSCCSAKGCFGCFFFYALMNISNLSKKKLKKKKEL
jgi:ribonuclease HI